MARRYFVGGTRFDREGGASLLGMNTLCADLQETQNLLWTVC